MDALSARMLDTAEAIAHELGNISYLDVTKCTLSLERLLRLSS